MTDLSAIDFFKQVYGDIPDWAAKMNQYAPKALEYYTMLRREILIDGALSKKEKELILVGINAARRYERSMIYHTKGALDSGATIEELIDVLATCIISRGIPAWMTGVQAILYAVSYRGEEMAGFKGLPTREGTEPSSATIEESYRYFEKDLGQIPQWADLLKQANPAAFIRYSELRRTVLGEDTVSRKFKELILVGINVAERYSEGVQLHVKGAKKYGAVDAEIAEVSLVALLTAGIPAWFEGSDLIATGE